jgi:hypothetical protein
MEIEQVAEENPSAILKEYIDPGMGLEAFQARKLAFGLGMDPAEPNGGDGADSIQGGDGTKRTGTLKVSVGYVDSYVGEGQISYAGPGAVARGRLALEIVAERLRLTGVQARELRFELIGVDSILGRKLSADAPEPREIRVRVVGRTDSLSEATRIANEVESLYLNGPASGGGVTKSARDIVGIRSTLLPENLVKTAVQIVES